jgi:type I restriction enzyme S subunit
MARDWIRLPAYSSKEEAERSAPAGWLVFQIEGLYDQLPVGKRFEQKTVASVGKTPVIDQSASGIIGWHNEDPGVRASPEDPVVTFANHTCEMRLMEEPFSVIQNVFPLVGKIGVCTTTFLYYLTKGRVWLEEYKGHFPEFRRKWVCCPPKSDQVRIVKIFWDIDRKIDMNRRLNQTLEAMAQAIFKSWFVDFDPVKAKITAKKDGRDPLHAAMSAISGKPHSELELLTREQFDQLAATAEMFPDAMDDTEMGATPKGWSRELLGDICNFVAGSAFKPEYQGGANGDYQFIKVSDMNLPGNEVFIQSANNYVSKSEQSEMRAKLHPVGATIFAKIGVALISNRRRMLITPTIIDNNLMSACPVEGKSEQYFLYSMLCTVDFNTLVSGTALPYINVSDLKKIAIVLPPLNMVQAFELKVFSIFSMMRTLASQCSTLAENRDALLPKLLSGEVDASEAAER